MYLGVRIVFSENLMTALNNLIFYSYIYIYMNKKKEVIESRMHYMAVND